MNFVTKQFESRLPPFFCRQELNQNMRFNRPLTGWTGRVCAIFAVEPTGISWCHDRMTHIHTCSL